MDRDNVEVNVHLTRGTGKTTRFTEAVTMDYTEFNPSIYLKKRLRELEEEHFISTRALGPPSVPGYLDGMIDQVRELLGELGDPDAYEVHNRLYLDGKRLAESVDRMQRKGARKVSYRPTRDGGYEPVGLVKGDKVELQTLPVTYDSGVDEVATAVLRALDSEHWKTIEVIVVGTKA